MKEPPYALRRASSDGLERMPRHYGLEDGSRQKQERALMLSPHIGAIGIIKALSLACSFQARANRFR